jgi:hypothetical protein
MLNLSDRNSKLRIVALFVTFDLTDNTSYMYRITYVYDLSSYVTSHIQL